MAGTILIRETDLTPLLTAIERARMRLLLYPNQADVAAFAGVACEEMGKIIKAKEAYDEAVSRAIAVQKPEREEFRTVRATEVRP